MKYPFLAVGTATVLFLLWMLFVAYKQHKVWQRAKQKGYYPAGWSFGVGMFMFGVAGIAVLIYGWKTLSSLLP